MAEAKGVEIKRFPAAKTLRKLPAECFYELDRSDPRARRGHHRPLEQADVSAMSGGNRPGDGRQLSTL